MAFNDETYTYMYVCLWLIAIMIGDPDPEAFANTSVFGIRLFDIQN